MGVSQQGLSATTASTPDGEQQAEKHHGIVTDPVDSHGHVRGQATDPHHALHRGLKARHLSMIALGGAIGTGLLIGTGASLAKSGPGSLFISYSLIGFVVWIVMTALGEMAAWFPMSAGFTGYATRYAHPSLGFALGWCYWFKYIITTPNQLTAAALVVQYWVSRDTVNPGVFIAIFLVIILAINILGVRVFGEAELWLSSFKVLTIVGVIFLTFIIALGGGPNHDRTGFRYWSDPGAFVAVYETGSAGRFLGFWSIMTTAVFSFLGSELVGVTVAEAQNPRRTVPRAIKLTFYRIFFFYVLAVLFLGMCVPYNSTELVFATKASTGASASPFVVAIKLAGIGGLDHVLNACILVFCLSAANSDLYVASRTLYSLATADDAPRIFAKTDKRGLPYIALGTSSLFLLLGFLNVSNSSKTVFAYFVSFISILGLMSWISILTTHIFFVRARRAQGIQNSAMPYTAPLGLWGSYGALFMCCLVALTSNYAVFVEGFKYKTFITGYLGIAVYLIFLFGHMIVTKSKAVKPRECDLFTGKEIIDKEEEDFLRWQAEVQAARGDKKNFSWFYNKFMSWLF